MNALSAPSNDLTQYVPAPQAPGAAPQAGSTQGRRPTILFVDDEQDVLDCIQRMFRKQNRLWDMRFATSAKEAMDMLSQFQFDLLLTDMKMPELDGAAILQFASEKSPSTVRCVLSGHADNDSLNKSAHLIHQFLHKPSTQEVILKAIQTCLPANDVEERLQKFVYGLTSFPSCPVVYSQLVACTKSDSCSIAEVARIACSDPGIASKILQVVNSSFFSLAQEVRSVDLAVRYLGIEQVKRLALASAVFRQMQGRSQLANGYVERLWAQSMRCAEVASEVAIASGLPEPCAAEAFSAALLLDVGQLYLIESVDDTLLSEYISQSQPPCDLCQYEHDRFGFHHAQLGAYILQTWGLPSVITHTVQQHHHKVLQEGEPWSTSHAVWAAHEILQQTQAGESCSNKTVSALRQKLAV